MSDTTKRARELADLAQWLRSWAARESAGRGALRRIELFGRWADAVDALAAELAAAEKRNEELVDVLGKAERAIVDAQNIICPNDRQRWIGSGIILDEVRAALAAASEGKP